jgi:CheY-like chemotaxis protein
VITKNIFLVEDDEDDQHFFIEAIKEIDKSICICVAKNGVEALNKLDNMNSLPDVIFMDINMPLMNGFECLTLLKKHIRLKTIPVVILTTSNNPKEAEVAKVLGAVFFLSKPSDSSLWKRNIMGIMNLYFLPISEQKNYEHIVVPFLQESVEPHIIPLLKEKAYVAPD